MHAPHWLVSQPTWVPVRPRSSRSVWTSSRLGSTTTSRVTPFTVSVTCSVTTGPPAGHSPWETENGRPSGRNGSGEVSHDGGTGGPRNQAATACRAGPAQRLVAPADSGSPGTDDGAARSVDRPSPDAGSVGQPAQQGDRAELGQDRRRLAGGVDGRRDRPARAARGAGGGAPGRTGRPPSAGRRCRGRCRRGRRGRHRGPRSAPSAAASTARDIRPARTPRRNISTISATRSRSRASTAMASGAANVPSTPSSVTSASIWRPIRMASPRSPSTNAMHLPDSSRLTASCGSGTSPKVRSNRSSSSRASAIRPR